MGTIQTLVLKDAAGNERFIPVDREVLSIGRDLPCTIRVESPYVSRQHARIELRDDETLFVDLGSSNGSTINGHRVEGTTLLNPGDVIGIADVTIECIADTVTDGATRAYDKPQRVPAPPPDQLKVDAQAYQVFLGAAELDRRLSAQEFDLLRYLYDNRDRVCTSQELGDAIWGGGMWDKDMLHRLVHRLKQKLEPNPQKPRYLQTVPWVGYRVTP